MWIISFFACRAIRVFCLNGNEIIVGFRTFQTACTNLPLIARLYLFVQEKAFFCSLLQGFAVPEKAIYSCFFRVCFGFASECFGFVSEKCHFRKQNPNKTRIKPCFVKRNTAVFATDLTDINRKWIVCYANKNHKL